MSFINHFIASERNRQGISLEKLSSGLCFFTVMHKIENGLLYADKLLYDTILQRLGIIEEYFETYVSDDEHEIQQLRSGIVRAIKDKDAEKIDELIDKYKKFADFKNSLHLQYLKYTDILKMEMAEETPQKLAEMYRNLISITVPNFNKNSCKELLLSDLEVFYIVKYIMNLNEYDSESAYTIGEDLRKYFDKFNIKSTAKLRCYGILTLLLSRILIDKYEYNQAYELCSECIEELRKSDVFYNLLMLIDLKLEIMIKKEQYDDEYKKLTTWSETLSELYKSYDVNPDDTADFDFNYFSWKSYYVISDVIRIRRKMLGLSQEELSEGICDVKTISRIENKRTKIHPRNAEKLLSRLNLTGELYSDNIVNSDIDTHYLCLDTTGLMRKNEWEKAKENMGIIKQKLDMTNVVNKQFVDHKELILQRFSKVINDKDYIDKTKRVFNLTLRADKVFDYENVHLSKKELIIICNIIGALEKTNQITEMYKWIVVLEKYFSKLDYELIHFSKYAFFYRKYQSVLGNIDEINKSNDIAINLLKNCFSHGYFKEVCPLIFGIFWNIKTNKRNLFRNNIDLKSYKKIYMKLLKISYILAKIFKYNYILEFIKNEKDFRC